MIEQNVVESHDASRITLKEAYGLCRQVTISHYENFPVASLVLPRSIRKHIYPVYAFARQADDLADEKMDHKELLVFRELLHRSARETVHHPIFMALADTISKFALPLTLFDDLITAFLQDLSKKRYEDLPDLLDYCRYSANPVGRIILHLHGIRDPERLHYSDQICTALQLANFWQDIAVDLTKDRIYIPQTFLNKYHVTEKALIQRMCGENFRKLMKELVDLTRSIFTRGGSLLDSLPARLRWELQLTVLGGLTILDKIEKTKYNILAVRPKLTKTDWIQIAFKSFTKKRRFYESTE